MSKRSQLLASVPRLDALLKAAKAQMSPDLEVIGLCRECVWIEAGSYLVYNAAADSSSENQGLNEDLDCPLTERTIRLFELVCKLQPTTSEGREACAHVALGFATRGADDEIEKDAIGETLAWRLVEEMTGRSGHG